VDAVAHQRPQIGMSSSSIYQAPVAGGIIAAGLNPMSWDISNLVNWGVIYASIFTRVYSAVSSRNAKYLCRCDW
jgi:hypothetical protein